MGRLTRLGLLLATSALCGSGLARAEPTPRAEGGAALPRAAEPSPAASIGPAKVPAIAVTKSQPIASALSTAAPPVASPARPTAAPPAPPPEPVKLSDDPRPTLSPQTFVATLHAAERYRALADAGGWPSVPADAARLKPGDTSATIAILRQRLVLTGDLAEADRAGQGFDETVATALRHFQKRHGLEETGVIGPRTLAHLNITAVDRLRQLQNSASRLMGSKFAYGDRYIAVNIPSATVEAVERGIVSRRFVAVVGKPDRPSPQVETRVTSVNFNPTWTVPVSLIRKDIIPHVRKDPLYLAKMKIRLFDAAGTEIDPGTLDWSTERAVNYTVRQDSGVGNSLGEIRIDMPNRHSVYMHDTPSKRLFARTERAQSSGCVRVAGVKDLVAWLLEGNAGPGGPGTSWSAADIQAAIDGGKRIDARLTKPVPVAWVYLTGYAQPDGNVQFRDDIYHLDEPAPPANASAAPLTIDALVTSSINRVP